MPNTLPLPALVGLDHAIQALLLLAVEPRLRGAVFAAPAGTGKSSLARGFHALVGGEGWGLRAVEDSLPPGSQPSAPFIDLPLGADEESMLGGLDLEATLRAGRRMARAGLLARAHGGVVYADQINLLADGAANLLLGALDSGEVRLEREGLSLRAPARFCLLGSYDPAEGNPRRHLLDRVALLVTLPPSSDEQLRLRVIRHNLGLAEEPRTENGEPDAEDATHSAAFSGSSTRNTHNATLSSLWEEEAESMAVLVQHARGLLPGVRIAEEQIGQIAAAALAFGVEGHRADAFAVYAACAAAALGLRDEVDQADVELALRLVILPRATRLPAPPEQADQPPEQPPPPPPPEQADQPPDDAAQPPPSDAVPEEQVLAALAAELPAELDDLPFRALRRGRAGSRGSTSGSRGRHIRSAPGDPRRRRLDLAATLRAAAPWQPLRRTGQIGRTAPVALRADDLRVKQFRSKAGALFCFAVDASGSMALHRMRQAKGAVHALLQKAYVHRDRVALLAFRGDRADLLLPPSQSVELARRALDLLPTGGGTPLAAALLAALDVARQARSRGIMQTVLILLTDGRANVGLRAGREGVEEELRALSRSVAAAGIRAMVIDTQRSYLSRGEARRLAEWLGGQYVYLPNAKGEQIAAMAEQSFP
ncbi:MAG TPA: magnesium chelatase ATPase subunit D [Roseiflexaceae bacterium]|nr:magnesium chelatase ATPase subunit D [Roseiflexaceae bacterium]